jgi:hypothetical protein
VATLVPNLEQAGVRLAIENHDRFSAAAARSRSVHDGPRADSAGHRLRTDSVALLRRLQGAILWGTERIIKPDWRKVSGPEQVQDAVRCMLHPEEYAPREENHATAYQ